MSAFLHDDAHITALLAGGLAERYGPLRWDVPGQNPSRYNELTRDTVDDVGRMLVAENLKSMKHRYPQLTRQERTAVYGGYTDPERRYTPVELLKALGSYEYQSCEHNEWPTSEAYAFCDALRRSLITRLPGWQEAGTWAIVGGVK